jgi:hypothetical protein
MNELNRYITTARPLSSGGLLKDSKKLSGLYIKKKKLFSKINLSEYKNDEIINNSLNKSRNSRKYNIPFMDKYKHIDINIIQDLTSKEPKGLYTYDTYNTISNISNNTKRSFFEDKKTIENQSTIKSKRKKLFLTTPVPQIYLSNNDDLTNMKTQYTIENEGKNNETINNKNNNKIKSSLKIKKVKSLAPSKRVTLENILLKKNIESNKKVNSNMPKELKRNSIVDRLLFKITNPDECFEEYLSSEKPMFDKYIKFKKQIQKKQLQTYKMLLDVELEQVNTMKELKKYNVNLKRIEYILKTKYNNQYLYKYKQPY